MTPIHRQHCILATFIYCLALLCCATAKAGVSSAALRETMEYLSKTFGREVAETGTESVARKLEALAVRYGDDALKAAQKIGPRALRYADEAGELGATALRLMSRYGDDALRIVGNKQALKLTASIGDDAAEAILKHGPDMTEKLLTEFGADGAKALAKLSRNEALELATKQADNAIAALPNPNKFLQVISQHGNGAMKFATKHWKVLLGGAAFTAFVTNPEPYINGTLELVDTAAANTVGKAIDVVGNNTNWTLWLSLGLLLGAALVALRMLLSHRLKKIA